MPTQPPAMLRLLARFAPDVSQWGWPHALVSAAGAIRAPGRRSVIAASRVEDMGDSLLLPFTIQCEYHIAVVRAHARIWIVA
jgi:hypothetical protein